MSSSSQPSRVSQVVGSGMNCLSVPSFSWKVAKAWVRWLSSSRLMRLVARRHSLSALRLACFLG